MWMGTEKEKSLDSGIPELCLKWGATLFRDIPEGFLEETAPEFTEVREALVSNRILVLC